MLGVSSLTPAPPWLRRSVTAAILMLLANTAVEAAGQSTQEEILVTVRRQLEGSEPSEGLLPAASGSACFWAGVACDPLGAVTSLDFSSQGLSGTLPAQLAGLAGLQSLVLTNNSIGGMLPVEWSSLMDLEVLALDTNAITGSLPAMWAALGSLRELRLRNNRLSGGGLPAAWGGGLGALQVLDLSDNPHLGQGMGRLGAAVGPSTGDSGAGAQLPGSWGRLTFLRSLLLRNTGLAGTLPPDLATLRRLVRLDLSSNSFGGILPAAWAPGSSPVRGAGSSGAGGLTALRQVDLSSNRLWGTLPADWSSFASLQYLSLAGNALSGTVPEAWGAQRGLAALLLSSNAALCGPVPGVLQPMLLAATANTTVSCGNCTSSAQETSALAAAINGTQLLRSCTWLQEGSLLLSLRHSMSGPSSTLAEWAEGTDPCGVANAWEGVLCDSVAHTVTGLDLSDKGLSGTLPPQLALLSGLGRLVLDGNSITGTLPSGWSQLAALSYISVRRNSLAGVLPECWSALSALSYLDLSHNGLRGPLPPAWGTGLPRIAHINLDGNSLNGTLPSVWGSGASASTEPAAAGTGTVSNGSSPVGLVTLVTLHADSNSLSGSLPAAWSRLRQLQELSLKDNLFTGPVPHEWADPGGMSSLRYLGLSSNAALCGPAPAATPTTATAATANTTGGNVIYKLNSSSTNNATGISNTNSSTSTGSAVFQLEADYTQLGAACPPQARNGGGGAVAAGAQLWIAAGAGSIGTLVLVGVIAAAASAVNRRRAAVAGSTDAAAKHGSIAAAVAARRRASTGGGADSIHSPVPGSPRAPAGSPRCASMTSPSGRVGSYGGIHGLTGGAMGPLESPPSFLVAQRLRSAPSPSAMLHATTGSCSAAASAARQLYGGAALGAASDGDDGGGRKARSHALQQQYRPRISHLAPNRASGAPATAQQRGMDGGGASLTAADAHLSPWRTSAAAAVGGSGGRVRAPADDGSGLHFGLSPTRSQQQPRSPLNTPPLSPLSAPCAPSSASGAPLPAPHPVLDALPTMQHRLESFGWLWGDSAGTAAGRAAASATGDEHLQARSGLLSTRTVAAVSSFTRIVGGFLPRRSSAGGGMPTGFTNPGAAGGVMNGSPRPQHSPGGQPGNGACGEAGGSPDEDMAAAAELYQAMALADQQGAKEAARSGASTPHGVAAIRSPRLSTNPLFAGPGTDADYGNTAGGGTLHQQSDPAVTASGGELEQLQRPNTQAQRKLRVSAGLGEDDSDLEQQSPGNHAAAGDMNGAAHMLAAPTFMFRPAEGLAALTACDQGPGHAAGGAAAHGDVSVLKDEAAAAGFSMNSPRLGMPPMPQR